MQPTLNGILGHPTTQEPPNPLIRVWDTAIRGRTWVNSVAEDDESISSMEEVSRLFFFTYTKIETNKGHTYWIHAPLRTLSEKFLVNSIRDYQRGQPIARGFRRRDRRSRVCGQDVLPPVSRAPAWARIRLQYGKIADG